jgi:hypothetical protein
MSIAQVISIWAASSAYDYNVVAKSGDAIGGVTLNSIGAPFISDNGIVLFLGDYPNGFASGAMFSRHFAAAKGGSVLIKQGDVISGLSVHQISSAKRNDNGEVVFSSTYNGGFGPGIFRLKAKVAAAGDIIGGLTLNGGLGGYDLNDFGEIVFGATYPSPDGVAGLGYGIFTPNRIIVKSGDMIGGATLISVNNPALSKSGTVVFSGSYSDTPNHFTGAIFTQHRMVVKIGDTVGGLTLAGLSQPAINELGAIGFEGRFGGFGRAFFINHALIAKTGDTIDGLTLTPPGDPLAPLGGLTLNASGEGLFGSSATNRSGASTGGWFTQNHSVVAIGDTVAGISVAGLSSASINDSGQVAFDVLYLSPSQGEAVIVATPNGR